MTRRRHEGSEAPLGEFPLRCFGVRACTHTHTRARAVPQGPFSLYFLIPTDVVSLRPGGRFSSGATGRFRVADGSSLSNTSRLLLPALLDLVVCFSPPEGQEGKTKGSKNK